MQALPGEQAANEEQVESRARTMESQRELFWERRKVGIFGTDANGLLNPAFVAIAWRDGAQGFRSSGANFSGGGKGGAELRSEREEDVGEATHGVPETTTPAESAAQMFGGVFPTGDGTEGERNAEASHEGRKTEADPSEVMNAIKAFELMKADSFASRSVLPEKVVDVIAEGKLVEPLH